MLEPSDRARNIVARVREFVREEVTPLETRLAGTSFREMLPELGQLRERARGAGLWTPFLPRELGGLGLSLYDYAFVSEELGRTPLGHYALNCQAPDVGNMELLLAHGNDQLKTRYL